MATQSPAPASITPDPLVRRVRKNEVDALMPACVAMFTEEVGISPLAGDGGLLYQARAAELVGGGRSFARFAEDGSVVFKAEIGSVTAGACQLTSVHTVMVCAGGGGASVPGKRILDSDRFGRFNLSVRRTRSPRRCARGGTVKAVKEN